jgi:hypothetical protein
MDIHKDPKILNKYNGLENTTVVFGLFLASTLFVSPVYIITYLLTIVVNILTSEYSIFSLFTKFNDRGKNILQEALSFENYIKLSPPKSYDAFGEWYLFAYSIGMIEDRNISEILRNIIDDKDTNKINIKYILDVLVSLLIIGASLFPFILPIIGVTMLCVIGLFIIPTLLIVSILMGLEALLIKLFLVPLILILHIGIVYLLELNRVSYISQN